jgi:hypothetical protein
MSNRKIDQLPQFTGDASGVHIVMNNSSNTTTYTITKETLLDGNNTFHGNQIISGALSILGTTTLGGNIVPFSPRGATLGTLELPFADIFVSSGSINIQSDVIGDPNTTISNIGGNLLVSAGGMRLLGSASFIAETGSFKYISGSMEQEGDYHQTGDYELLGNKIITGSLTVSGSQTLIGIQILRGDKIVTGSINISGSQNFIGTQILRGNKTITGSLYIQSGSLFPQSTGSSLVTYNQTTGQLAHAKFESVISSLFSYGQFYSTGSQTNPVANVSHSMVYETLDFASGFSVVSGSRLTNTNKGVYNLQFSSQFQQTTNVDSNFSIWFRKNGLNISGSNTEVSIAKNSKGTSEVVAAWNYLYQANVNDYIEIMWSSPDTHLEILYGGTQTNPNRPTTPSVIVTVTQMA